MVLEKMDQAFAPGQAKNELNGEERVFFLRPKLKAMDTVANILRNIDLFDSFAGRKAIG